jgi:hypothetical protein
MKHTDSRLPVQSACLPGFVLRLAASHPWPVSQRRAYPNDLFCLTHMESLAL